VTWPDLVELRAYLFACSVCRGTGGGTGSQSPPRRPDQPLSA